jgi:hypothetical protein
VKHIGEGKTHLPILADGVFGGLGRLVPGSIVPKRKLSGDGFSEADFDFNAAISHDRTIVELSTAARSSSRREGPVPQQCRPRVGGVISEWELRLRPVIGTSHFCLRLWDFLGPRITRCERVSAERSERFH